MKHRSRAARSPARWLRMMALGALSGSVIGCAGPAEPPQPAPDAPLKLVSGRSFSCVLDANAELICWGQWSSFPIDPVPRFVHEADDSIRYRDISARGHACALTDDGEAWCWGRNVYGQIGDGTTDERPLPTRVQSAVPFAAIAAGADATCGLSEVGTLYCWGQGDYGALADGTAIEGAKVLRPKEVPGQPPFASLSLAIVGCALEMNNAARCWGMIRGSFDEALHFEPGDCHSTFYIIFEGTSCLTPTPVAGNFTFERVTAGGETSCGDVVGGTIACWGAGSRGTLGNGQWGPGTHAVQPVLVLSNPQLSHVTVGVDHACGLAADGSAWCWGNNFVGQLGDEDSGGLSAVPIPVTGGHRFTSIDAGYAHTCGIDERGRVWCWGSGSEGELGQPGNRTNSSSPVLVTLPRRN